MTDAHAIAVNLAVVRARMAKACAKCARSIDDVRLVAVSKTKPAADVRAAFDAGQRVFGENYAQELVDKHTELAALAAIEWHFVGHVQTTKAKLVAERATMIHAVDSVRLATELGRRASARATPLEVLLEVNVGGEATKSGVAPEALEALVEAVERIDALRLRGLMSIPPPSDSAESSRPFHRSLRALRDRLGGVARLPELSMGMTDDLEVAIEEGATLVRVGTAIFGARG
ncbi:MAG: YggS family pyridoxal phosphate-dependent enzyme [Polyangiales bacterium]